jgi:hypothetical protein
LADANSACEGLQTLASRDRRKADFINLVEATDPPLASCNKETLFFHDLSNHRHQGSLNLQNFTHSQFKADDTHLFS